MNKDDELVWVFPACAMEDLQGLPGITPRLADWRTFAIDILPKCTFMRRGDVEDEPTLQQVIPYVVCRNGSLVLLYNRGDKGGEKRLADKWSIGVGGHINPGDTKKTPQETLQSAMTREMLEELTAGGFRSDPPVLRYFGLLKSEGNAVDAVHFGVVFQAHFAAIAAVVATTEIERHMWVTLEELENYPLENWSEMVRDELLKEEESDAPDSLPHG